MFSAFRKDIYREIKKTFGRFFAIFAIVLLGVAFYTGIGSTGLDMKTTGDLYFTEKNLMDIRVVSTYGINDNDISAIRDVEGVEAVYPAYNIDALVHMNDIQAIMKLHSIDAGSNDANIPDLLSGRMPLADNEAIAEPIFASGLNLQLGDSFILESGKKTDLRDSLKNVRFTLVGIVNSAYYVSNAERGPSSIGSGSANAYMYIPQSNFKQNVYSEAFITVSNARDHQCFSDNYAAIVEEVADRLEALGDIRVKERYIEATGDAYSSLANAEAELIASGRAAADEYYNLYTELAASRQSLETARRGLVMEQERLGGGLRDLDSAKEFIRNSITSLDEAFESAQSQQRELSRASLAIVEALAVLEQEASGLTEKETLLRAAYMDDPQILIMLIGEIAGAREEISKTRETLQYDLETAYAGEAAVGELMRGISDSRATLGDELVALNAGINELNSGDIDIISGFAEISYGINELDRQLKLLEEQEADTYMGMDASLAQIKAARNALDALDKPKWYVTDRDSNPGYSGFFNDADNVEAIGKVFPFIFFVVAALVSLTTMTRLVEERRTEIGTLKSLGYVNAKIISKYIIYAAIPTILGGFFGGLIGMRFFPGIIIKAYQSLYTIPAPVTILDTDFWILGASFGIVSTLGATMAACLNELRAPPWTLMRPKPPKKGTRIFLEYIPPLWNSLTFIWKVTIRNIIRYKKRFFMTVAGVAGCTALLITGFGLRDSIDTMMRLQYGEVHQYDLLISFTETAKATDLGAVESMLKDNSIVRGYMPYRHKLYDAGGYGDSKGVISVNLVVPSDADVFQDYTNLRDRLTHTRIQLPENAVVISEKLAIRLDLRPGDVFYIEAGSERFDVTVADIAENYYMHYVYMHERLYSRLYGAAPEYNSMYVLFADHTDEQMHQLGNSILEQRGVGIIFLTSTVYDAFVSVLNSLNFVVYVLILSAAALAIVVLWNLTNININERKRELATIGVLGFHDREVSAYIYREIIILTLVGAATGLVLGVFLHAFVVLTAETDFVMFGRQIKPVSYLYAILLTMLFASFVNFITGKRLRRINMVDALKSIE